MGPTGSGKTSTAVALARNFPVTAVVADLRQVMSGMVIGSAQPTPDELAALPHKLSGVLDPATDITVNDWRKLAEAAIAEVITEDRIPLVLGGSGLAVQALISGARFDAPPAPILRKALNRWLDEGALDSIVEAAGDAISGLIRRDEFTNPHRVIRAIERFAYRNRETPPPAFLPDFVKDACARQTDAWCGLPEATSEDDDEMAAPAYAYRIFALDPDLKWLAERIHRRAKAMFEGGMLDEVKALLERGVARDARALKGHGYPEAIGVLDGDMSIDEAIEKTAAVTRKYAKRQMTWLKGRFDDVEFIRVGEDHPPEDAADVIGRWLEDNWPLSCNSTKQE